MRLDLGLHAPDSRYNPFVAHRPRLDLKLRLDPAAHLLQVCCAWTHCFPGWAGGCLLENMLVDRCHSGPAAA